MFGFHLAQPPRRKLPATAEIGTTMVRIVSIRRQDMHTALVQHALGPILRTGAEPAGEGCGGNLHPHARIRQTFDEVILRFDPM